MDPSFIPVLLLLCFRFMCCCCAGAGAAAVHPHPLSVTLNGRTTAKYPNSLQGSGGVDAVPTTATNAIDLSLTVGSGGVFPMQSVAEFSAPDTPPKYFSLGRKKDKLHLTLDALIDLETPCNLIALKSIPYEVRILLSDENFEAVDWKIGKITVPVQNTPALQQKCESSENVLWAKRPEFFHQFKPPAPRAPTSAAVAATIVILVVPNCALYWLLTKINCSVAVTHLPFHGMLLAMMAVITVYWLNGLRIFPTLFLLLFTGAIAIFFRPQAAALPPKNLAS
eukprot:NODE_1337_length_957_cov_178.254405_g1031_i0.p1 GENE.NODE_1337_length_957_cov_178.254405_g1031_i0~~NODE_1337_length_957_cov_178.254405_g1031_i0.p1  ORF type:complete len:281 (-),score=66.03 NODE_1337_length_957_cov_178.254405_g1031_i0:58-900(-)